MKCAKIRRASFGYAAHTPNGRRYFIRSRWLLVPYAPAGIVWEIACQYTLCFLIRLLLVASKRVFDMKHRLIWVLSALTFAACDNNSDCSLSHSDCSTPGFILNRDTCSCECALTAIQCSGQGYRLDSASCSCVEMPTACKNTQESCADEGLVLDEKSCRCVKDAHECTLTEKSCAANGQVLDEAKCKCVERQSPACNLTPESCSAEEYFDEENCKCMEHQSPACDLTSESCEAGQYLDADDCKCVDISSFDPPEWFPVDNQDYCDGYCGTGDSKDAPYCYTMDINSNSVDDTFCSACSVNCLLKFQGMAEYCVQEDPKFGTNWGCAPRGICAEDGKGYQLQVDGTLKCVSLE